MDKQFDELSKSLAEGVSRREALRKFGIGLAGVLLACLGIGGGASADQRVKCASSADCSNLGFYSPGCCKGICTELRDIHNCGTCGNHCPHRWTCEQPY